MEWERERFVASRAGAHRPHVLTSGFISPYKTEQSQPINRTVGVFNIPWRRQSRDN